MKKLVLSVAVLVLLASVSIHSQNKPKKMFDKKAFGMKVLNLTEDQQGKMKQLKIDHEKQMIDLVSELKKKELSFKELKLNGNISRDSYLSAVKDISSVKNRIAESRANHRMDVYEMLDENQKGIWLKMDHTRGTREKGDRIGMHRQHERMN